MIVGLGDATSEEIRHGILVDVPRLLSLIVVVEVNFTGESRAVSADGSRDVGGENKFVIIDTSNEISLSSTIVDGKRQNGRDNRSYAGRPVIVGVTAGAESVAIDIHHLNSGVNLDWEVVPDQAVNSIVNVVSDRLGVSPGDVLGVEIVVSQVTGEAVGVEFFAGVHLFHIDILSDDDGVIAVLGDTGDVNCAFSRAIRVRTRHGTDRVGISSVGGGVTIVQVEVVVPVFVGGVSVHLSGDAFLA